MNIYEGRIEVVGATLLKDARTEYSKKGVYVM